VKTADIARNAVKVGKLEKEAVKAGKLAKNARSPPTASGMTPSLVQR